MSGPRIPRRGFALTVLLSFVAMVAAPQRGVICHEHPGGELAHSHPEDALFVASTRAGTRWMALGQEQSPGLAARPASPGHAGSRELRDDAVLIVSSARARRAPLPLAAVLSAGDEQGFVAAGSTTAGRVVRAPPSRLESGVLAVAEPPSSAHLHWQSPFHRVAPPRALILVVAWRIVPLETTADPAGPEVRLNVGRARSPPSLLST